MRLASDEMACVSSCSRDRAHWPWEPWLLHTVLQHVHTKKIIALSAVVSAASLGLQGNQVLCWNSRAKAVSPSRNLILSTFLLPDTSLTALLVCVDIIQSLCWNTHCIRGVKLIFAGNLISLTVAFKGPKVILGLYKCNYSLTVKELKLHSALWR